MGAIVTGGLEAFGIYQQAQAEKAAAQYNARVSLENAQVAKANADISAQSGEAQAGLAGQRTRAVVGQIKANQGASGVEVNTGSAADTVASASEVGELDALTVRSNAMREAYGYSTQAQSQEAQANLDKYEAESAQAAGDIGAASTFLGAMDQATANFAKFQMGGGFSG